MNEAAMTAREERISKIEAATAGSVEGTSGSSSQSLKGGMPRMIKAAHFDQALRNISPSISEKVLVTSIFCHVLILEVPRYRG